jgi:hypothetical protein
MTKKRTKKDKRTPKARRASAAFGRIMREKSAMAGMATAAMMTLTPQSMTFTPNTPALDNFAVYDAQEVEP